MKKKFILFDFDGVIADSFRPAFDVHKTIRPHMDEEDFRGRFDGNVNDWAASQQNPAEVTQQDDNFVAEYLKIFGTKVQIFAGMENVIVKLAGDYTLVIISSTRTSVIEEFLAKHNLSKYFINVLGNDVHASKVEKMRMVFEKYKISADDCVFVTDTLGDLNEAAEVNVGAIAVTWGFHGSERLLKAKSFRLVEKPGDLIVAVSDYFKTIK